MGNCDSIIKARTEQFRQQLLQYDTELRGQCATEVRGLQTKLQNQDTAIYNLKFSLEQPDLLIYAGIMAQEVITIPPHTEITQPIQLDIPPKFERIIQKIELTEIYKEEKYYTLKVTPVDGWTLSGDRLVGGNIIELALPHATDPNVVHDLSHHKLTFTHSEDNKEVFFKLIPKESYLKQGMQSPLSGGGSLALMRQNILRTEMQRGKRDIALRRTYNARLAGAQAA